MKVAWTPEALAELGPTVDVPTAARFLGISRSTSYELCRTGQFPVRVIRVGSRYRVVTSDLTGKSPT